MARFALTLVLCLAGLTSCSRPRDDRSRPGPADRDGSAARSAGHAAYGAAEESKDLARKAGKSLWKAGKEAHEGWKDAQREDREKRPK